MEQSYPKQYSTPTELVQLLKQRGLAITDEKKAAEYIQNIGYFRLSAYFYPFLKAPKGLHQFKSDSSFSKVIKLYRFDRKLRMLMFNEIEKIEVAVRSAIVNITAQETNNPFWMTDVSTFANAERYQKMIALIGKEYNQSKEDFIQHFRQTYSNPYPPAWELAEILPLGILTRVYENIKSNQIRKRIAQHFYLNIPVFESWLTIITLTRNSCCHHSRVWNKEYAFRSRTMNKMSRPWINATVNQQRIFYNLSIIKYFLDIISPNNHFRQRIVDLFVEFPIVDKTAMGFPENWEQEALWLK